MIRYSAVNEKVQMNFFSNQALFKFFYAPGVIILTLKVLVATIDALGHFETG